MSADPAISSSSPTSRGSDPSPPTTSAPAGPTDAAQRARTLHAPLAAWLEEHAGLEVVYRFRHLRLDTPGGPGLDACSDGIGYLRVDARAIHVEERLVRRLSDDAASPIGQHTVEVYDLATGEHVRAERVPGGGPFLCTIDAWRALPREARLLTGELALAASLRATDRAPSLDASVRTESYALTDGRTIDVETDRDGEVARTVVHAPGDVWHSTRFAERDVARAGALPGLVVEATYVGGLHLATSVLQVVRDPAAFTPTAVLPAGTVVFDARAPDGSPNPVLDRELALEDVPTWPRLAPDGDTEAPVATIAAATTHATPVVADTSRDADWPVSALALLGLGGLALIAAAWARRRA